MGLRSAALVWTDGTEQVWEDQDVTTVQLAEHVHFHYRSPLGAMHRSAKMYSTVRLKSLLRVYSSRGRRILPYRMRIAD
jgi:hypothetical protein